MSAVVCDVCQVRPAAVRHGCVELCSRCAIDEIERGKTLNDVGRQEAASGLRTGVIDGAATPVGRARGAAGRTEKLPGPRGVPTALDNPSRPHVSPSAPGAVPGANARLVVGDG